MKKILVLFAALALSTTASFSAMAADKVEKVGVALMSLSNPFFKYLDMGIKSGLKNIDPSIEVTTVSAEYDLNRQASQIDTFISNGTQIIFLNAADSVAIGPFVEKAKAAGLIVVAVDVQAAGATFAVRTNNYQAGQIVCEDLAKRLKGKGDMVIIDGPPVTVIKDRIDGCMSVLKNYPDIKIISKDQDGKGERDGSLAVMQGLLIRFPKIDAVFGQNDPTAIGADLAAKQFGRNEMIIAGVDASPDLIDIMKKGDTRIVSAATQYPFAVGKVAADLAVDYFNGKKPEHDPTLLDARLMTMDNLDTYIGWEVLPEQFK